MSGNVKDFQSIMETWGLKVTTIGCLAITAFITASIHARTIYRTEPRLTPDELREAQTRLVHLGYWAGPIDGTGNEWLLYATMAFQRMYARDATGHLTRTEFESLRKATPLQPRTTGYLHVEIDVSRQILFVVNADNRVNRVLPIATGSDKRFKFAGRTYRARTPLGQFTIERKIDGWRQSPLGLMYYPNYFKRGFAIHGSRRFPRRPVTHGCIAIPLFAAEIFSREILIGTSVLIY